MLATVEHSTQTRASTSIAEPERHVTPAEVGAQRAVTQALHNHSPPTPHHQAARRRRLRRLVSLPTHPHLAVPLVSVMFAMLLTTVLELPTPVGQMPMVLPSAVASVMPPTGVSTQVGRVTEAVPVQNTRLEPVVLQVWKTVVGTMVSVHQDQPS